MMIWEENLNESYDIALGRRPNPSEKTYWAGRSDELGHTMVSEIVSWHMNWLVSQAGSKELDAMIMRSYQNAFQRAPTQAELSYWRGDVKSKKHTYRQVTEYHKNWKKAPSVVTKSYRDVFGRDPSQTERDYWLSAERREKVGRGPLAA